jgi:hypothetical protein
VRLLLERLNTSDEVMEDVRKDAAYEMALISSAHFSKHPRGHYGSARSRICLGFMCRGDRLPKPGN